MRLAAVGAGDRVLINGAGGSIGGYGVQIAKALGAEVIGVDAGIREALVMDFGADRSCGRPGYWGAMQASAGGAKAAVWNCTIPSYEIPTMPTRDVAHGWAAIHSTTCAMSWPARQESANAAPNDAPVPRRSMETKL